MPNAMIPLARGVWPPAPLQSQKSPPDAARSRERLGLLTRHFLIDFILGLALGLVTIFLLGFGFDIIAGWIVPTLPTPSRSNGRLGSLRAWFGSPSAFSWSSGSDQELFPTPPPSQYLYHPALLGGHFA